MATETKLKLEAPEALAARRAASEEEARRRRA